MNKKSLVYVIISLVLILVALVMISKTRKAPISPKNESGSATSSPFTPSITIVPTSTVPSALPANLPLEAGAKVLQNFEGSVKDSNQTQSTRVYVSSKTVDQNFTIYKKYLQDNNWMITSTVDQPNVKNFDASKGTSRMTVTIAKDSAGQVTVNVSYTD